MSSIRIFNTLLVFYKWRESRMLTINLFTAVPRDLCIEHIFMWCHMDQVDYSLPICVSFMKWDRFESLFHSTYNFFNKESKVGFSYPLYGHLMYATVLEINKCGSCSSWISEWRNLFACKHCTVRRATSWFEHGYPAILSNSVFLRFECRNPFIDPTIYIIDRFSILRKS